MFNKLQAKWKVKGWELALIITTFAIGGSLTGFTGRKLLGLTGMEHTILYYILYVVVMTLLWPFAVLLVSIPLGQYPFFIQYIKRMLGRLAGKSHSKVMAEQLAVGQLAVGNIELQVTRIAIFASGAGSNAQKIIDHFKNNDSVEIVLIVSNKPGAGVLSIAANEGIATILIDKESFFRGGAYVNELKQAGVQFIVLAGFLWKIPLALIKAYPNKIVNIHPALLPKYGGKGMYGHFVHETVIANGDAESGITIHYVDEQYDHGSTIFQATCPVLADDTADTLASRIHKLEHEHYPKVIADCLKKLQ
jgi:formyltetrahydrofolate-dependent phosphoribosylglycinamide formyltransferase